MPTYPRTSGRHRRSESSWLRAAKAQPRRECPVEERKEEKFQEEERGPWRRAQREGAGKGESAWTESAEEEGWRGRGRGPARSTTMRSAEEGTERAGEERRGGARRAESGEAQPRRECPVEERREGAPRRERR
eukprot:3605577-Rhodomonas_salina.1